MKRVYKKWLLLMFFMATGHWAFAQFTATGTIADADGEPLIGVNVIVKGTAIGTITDLDGRFSLSVPSDPATLEISYIGYGPQTVEVSSASSSVEVVLVDDITQLDEIVVTGLGTSVKRSNLANSVASIQAKELTGITTQSTMDGALYGKFKGAEIRSTSGAPGGGMSVRLRGVTSVFGDQQPLFIVDGVYVDNSTVSLGTNVVTEAAGGGNTETTQDDASNRIADIDPEDIENIEILKGASAAAIYGSRAAGGVIIITTKRGKSGKTRVTFNQTVGIRRPIRLLGTRDWTQQRVNDVFGAADAALFAQNGNLDYEDQIYNNTRVQNTSRLSVSGGDGKTDFFVGFTYKDENGLVENTGYEKGSLRLNVGHRFNDWLDIYVTNNFINSQSDRGLFNNGNTNTTVGYALAFTKPWVDLSPNENGVYPANPEVGSNPLETINLITNQETINRNINSATINMKLISSENNSLKLQLQGGYDQYTLRSTSLFPQQLSFYRNPGTLGGVSVSGTTVNTNYNLQALLVHTYFTPSGISFRTQGGLFLQNFDQNTVITTATGLNGSQSNVDQAANVASFQNREPQTDKGAFFQEEINYRDRIIATLGIRGDKSTNNGDVNQIYYYPKASLAVNLHSFDFWNSTFITQLKPRIAYGQSGRFANFEDRFTTLDPTVIGGGSGLFPDLLRGNPNVEPERQSELEMGLDFGFVDNRITVDATYYIKEVDDLLLRVGIPTSQGFTQQVLNAGALQNKGIEIGVNALIVDKGDFSWNATLNWWRNRSEITRLDVPAFNIGGFAASLGQYRIEEGKSATQIVGNYNAAECDNCDPDGDGITVFGDAQADFDMSWLNVIQYKNFEFSFLWHWKQGGDGVNLSTLLYDLGNLTWDYDERTLDPTGQEVNGDFRKNAGSASPWIEDTGYIRLREVGIYYNIPKRVFNDAASVRIGFSGRNLINIFDYNSYDPEVSNFGNNVLANAVEVTPYPSSKFYNFNLRVTL